MRVNFISKILDLLPDLQPIDGKTWVRKFSKVSFVNVVLTAAIMVVMYMNTTIFGLILYSISFWLLFGLLIINDINYFIIAMERLIDANLSPFYVFPLFIFTLLFLYIGRILAVQLLAANGFVFSLVVVIPILCTNILFFRYLPSKQRPVENLATSTS